MTTVLRASLGALAAGMILCVAGVGDAQAGPCVAAARSVATTLDADPACAPARKPLPGITVPDAVPAPPLPFRAMSLPDSSRFALSLLATMARMSDHTIDYTISGEPVPLPPQGPISASVAADGGMAALLHAPTVLGRAFMLDLGLLLPELAASGVNPFVSAAIGGVTTLVRPKESSWSRPNYSTMFSDLFGEPESTDGKPATRAE